MLTVRERKKERRRKNAFYLSAIKGNLRKEETLREGKRGREGDSTPLSFSDRF
jgi:hypothetical protein